MPISKKFKACKTSINRVLSTSIESDSVEDDVNRSIRFAAGFITFVVVGFIFWFWVINKQELSVDSTVWGAFGDFVGGILNPVIAFLAFYWLTRSVLIQKKELSETQKVLAQTEIATAAQARTLEKQRFENSFYSLLEQMNNVASELKANDERRSDRKSKLKILHSSILAKLLVNDDITIEQHLKNTNKHMLKKSKFCNHYFRVIYHLLKFILINFESGHSVAFEQALKRDLTEEEKFYSNIVRSFLDNETIQLLAINCICEEDSDFYKYRQLLERYEMLEHVHFEADWMEGVYSLYDSKAFGKNDGFTKFSARN
ncbi:putative phage abortive infection protein [Vibrio sp. WJH972]